MNPSHRDTWSSSGCARSLREGDAADPSTHRPIIHDQVRHVPVRAERLTIDEAWPGDSLGASTLRISASAIPCMMGYQSCIQEFPFCAGTDSHRRPTDVSNQKRRRKGLEHRSRGRDPDPPSTGRERHTDPGGCRGNAVRSVGAPTRARVRFARVSGTAGRAGCPAHGLGTAAELSRAGRGRCAGAGGRHLLALFASPYRLQRLATEHPEWMLDPMVTT